MAVDRWSRYVQANGINTHYHDAGDGPVVLLLHGSGPGVSAWANWNRTLPTLMSQFRVLAPDIVGFGQTERRDRQEYGVKGWTDHILAFLDALDIGRAHFVGNSMGGRLALTIATQQPERVDKLVLMGSPGPDAVETDGLRAVREYTPSLENMCQLIRNYFTFDASFASDSLVEMRYKASIEPGAHETYQLMFANPKNNGMTITERDLKGLDHQTLVIHGREDRVIPFGASVRLLELISNAQLHAFGQCGHWAQIEHDVAFNQALTAFLSR